MSYDLHLMKRDEIGDDPAAAYARLEEDEENAEQRELTPEEEQQLRGLADDLQAANPGVDLIESSKGFFQLGYEAERPVVIDIDSGEITMSWSIGASDAAPALAEVQRYLPVFERHGYVAYDPQLERLFDLERDGDDAAAIHADIRGQLESAYGRQRRPWWRRLLGSDRS